MHSVSRSNALLRQCSWLWASRKPKPQVLIFCAHRAIAGHFRHVLVPRPPDQPTQRNSAQTHRRATQPITALPHFLPPFHVFMDEPSGSSALHASPLRPPTVPQASWYQISEIVLAVFRALLHDEDIWSLAVCTRVCRTWRRVATAAAAQASGSVAIATAKVQALKQDSSIWLDPGIGNAAFADPFGRPPAEQYNRLLHEVLGRGSFARVWGLSGLRNVCVKVAVGGIAASHTVDRKAAEAHTVTLQYGYYTSGCVVRTLSHGEIGMVLYHEFLRVRSISAYSLPPEETRPLYARAQFFGTVGTTAYYTMERLYGRNMRHVLRAADKKHTVDQANIIDFAPLVQRLLRSMHHLVSVYGAFHGDMKPENIMLVADECASLAWQPCLCVCEARAPGSAFVVHSSTLTQRAANRAGACVSSTPCQSGMTITSSRSPIIPAPTSIGAAISPQSICS